ncbi:MAG: diacylglycerol kinase family protein [Thermoleophilaceae bacterium]
MSRRLALLVNPAASGGNTRALMPVVSDELDRRGAEFRVVVTRDAAHARAEAGQATAAGEAVVALGGDGFVGALAGTVSAAQGALAIVPAGRGNDFARVLGIPSDPREAARVALEGHERRVDIAAVDGRPFVGIASAGFDSDANRIANQAKLVRGSLVYAYAALRALAAWRPAAFEVVVDGRHHSMTGYSVAIANSKAYGGGMYLVPHAELDDGLLDVMLHAAEPKLHALRSLPKVFKGSHVDEPAFSFLRGAKVELSADRDFDVYADGDPIGRLPATMTVTRQGLRVIVP